MQSGCAEGWVSARWKDRIAERERGCTVCICDRTTWGDIDDYDRADATLSWEKSGWCHFKRSRMCTYDVMEAHLILKKVREDATDGDDRPFVGQFSLIIGHTARNRRV